MTTENCKDTERSLNSLINQRSQIWDRYDQGMNKAEVLNKLPVTYNSNAQTALPAAYDPPDAVAISIEQIQNDLSQIETCKKNIEQYNQEIEETKKQFFIIVAVVSAIFVIVIFVLLKR